MVESPDNNDNVIMTELEERITELSDQLETIVNQLVDRENTVHEAIPLGKDEAYCDWYKCPECGSPWINADSKYCPECGIKIQIPAKS